MHLQSFYVYVLLLDAHVTLHLAPLRPLVALPSTSTASQHKPEWRKCVLGNPSLIRPRSTTLLLRLHEHLRQTESAPFVYIYIFCEHFQCSE
jgi:hypothetical protein